MEIIYLVKARHRRGKEEWFDWWLVRAVSAHAARMMVFEQAQRDWGEDFFYHSMRITRALGERDVLWIIHQEV